MTRSDLINYLRDHIVGAMHVGQLTSGDRLPSIREVGKRLRKNERTIKAAYAALEREGLVEVRGRSGVFVARQGVLDGEMLEETSRWLAGVLTEAWKRRVRVSMLPELIERFTVTRSVRCGLVEQIEDAAVALRYELENEWGFDVEVVAPDALHAARGVDFFATTSFYAASAHAAAELLGKPLILLKVYPGLKDAIKSRIDQGWLTVVAKDARFADRIRIIYSPDDPTRVRFVAATDEQAVAALDPLEAVLLTRAARQRIGNVHVATIFPHSPTISPDSALLLATMLVRKHVGSY